MARGLPGGSSRETALDVLLDYSRRDAFVPLLLSSRLSTSGLDRRDRAFTTELVQGTIRMKGTLDWALSAFSSRPLETLDGQVLWLLRLAAYQVLFTRVKDYAACDTAADIAGRRSGKGAASYVNGVIRALVRGKESLVYPNPRTEPVRYLETRYSHPGWIVEMWIRELGFELTEEICRADNRKVTLCVRANLLKVEREELARRLRDGGFEVEPSKLVPEGLLVGGGGNPAEMPEYDEGLFSVQDQGSIVVGYALDLEPGMEVLDACAAPGGKANHAAELMGNRGRVLAVDTNEQRLAIVDRAAHRLGNTIVKTLQMDATRMPGRIEEGFDRVLVDAPCTGLGTLARRPDVRWRKRPSDVERLPELQGSLLRSSAKMVRPGGLLVYSTCTISRRENEDAVERFMRENTGFTARDVSGMVESGGGAPFLRLLPNPHGCDGMFIAVMERGE